MVRLNAVLMIVLALAVVVSATFLALEESASVDRDAARAERLLRKLTDPDPDVRREGEEGLRAMGPRAAAALREAARSGDRALADRAARLLEGSSPAPVPAPPRPESRDPGTAAVPPVLEGGEGPFRFLIECPDPALRAGEGILVYVRFRNDGPQPLLLAREGRDRYARFACFEAVDAKGRAFEVPAEPAREIREETGVVVVRPGETLDLYAGQGDGRTLLAAPFPGAGPFRVRFVYDASGDAYREAVAGRAEGTPLPFERLASNPLVLRIPE